MRNDEERGHYGRWLRSARLQRYSSAEAAVAAMASAGLHFDRPSFASIESGRIKPSPDQLAVLARFFGPRRRGKPNSLQPPRRTA